MVWKRRSELMKLDRFLIITVALVVTLSVAVPLTVVSTEPSHEEEVRVGYPYQSINLYLYFRDGSANNILPNTNSPMVGAGSTLSSVIENAFEQTDGHKIALLPNGAIGDVDGIEAEDGKMWVIFQWSPPNGWCPVTPGISGDTTLMENTSYLIAMSEYRESSGKTTYTAPDVDGPVSMAVFYLTCSTRTFNVKANQLGDGDRGEDLLEKLNEGMYIVGYGSTVAEAFADACRTTFQWEGPTYEGGAIVLKVPESRSEGLTDDQKIGLEMGDGGSGTIPGWLGTFMGLKDVNIADSYIYWNQYSWSDEEYKWGYNGFCLGYYDPSVTKYFALAYMQSNMSPTGDDSNSPFRDLDPHDYIPV